MMMMTRTSSVVAIGRMYEQQRGEGGGFEEVICKLKPARKKAEKNSSSFSAVFSAFHISIHGELIAGFWHLESI